jgi:hypothetical protein
MKRASGISAAMKWTAAGAATALILAWIAAPALAEQAPLTDPAFLNIGLSCRWDTRCMTVQRKAMVRSLAYVRNARPSAWRVQLCNRNARRGYSRVDWVGFDHCIRNVALSRAVARDVRRRARH